MNKEEFLKAIENVTKTDSINPISAYNSINVEDLANAVDRFKKVPTYDELLKENQKYKEVIDKAIENEEEIMYLANKVAITTQNIEVKALRDRLEEIFKTIKGGSNE